MISIADNGPPLTATAYQEMLHACSVEERLIRENSLATSYQIVTSRHGGQFQIHPQVPSPLLNSIDDAVGTSSPYAIGIAFELRLPVYPIVASSI